MLHFYNAFFIVRNSHASIIRTFTSDFTSGRLRSCGVQPVSMTSFIASSEEKIAMSTKSSEKNEPHSGERYREVGGQASWSLSTCKPGFGVEQLRDDCLETYWQSDGPQPHLVNIQFRRKTTVQDVCIYTDYKSDESYTPKKISIRAGTHFNDLQETEVVELTEPSGWVIIPLKDDCERPLRTYMIQIAVLSNHQNGRDTHMRQVKVHSMVRDCAAAVASDFKSFAFTSIDCAQYACIR